MRGGKMTDGGRTHGSGAVKPSSFVICVNLGSSVAQSFLSPFRVPGEGLGGGLGTLHFGAVESSSRFWLSSEQVAFITRRSARGTVRPWQCTQLVGPQIHVLREWTDPESLRHKHNTAIPLLEK